MGFIFHEKPDVSKQVENLILRATKRMFVLWYYSKFMPGKDLKKLYCALVRSVLEYSLITYHSMLTKKLENDLEIVQKKCLCCIYGYKKSYDELLQESGLLRLKERREIAVLKFAKKTSASPIYSHWFPNNPNPPPKEDLSYTKKNWQELVDCTIVQYSTCACLLYTSPSPRD